MGYVGRFPSFGLPSRTIQLVRPQIVVSILFQCVLVAFLYSIFLLSAFIDFRSIFIIQDLKSKVKRYFYVPKRDFFGQIVGVKKI